MPIIKNYKIRYWCNVEAKYIYEVQQNTVVMPTVDPLGHTLTLGELDANSLVIVDEWIEQA